MAISGRAPTDVVRGDGHLLSLETIDLDWLASVIRDANEPVTLDALVRHVVRAAVVRDGQLRAYAAGRRYSRGERLRFRDGRLADVTRVEPGGNDVQGAFDVVTLRLRSGDTFRMAAGVENGDAAATPGQVAAATVDAVLAEQRPALVRRLRDAIAADPRFITLYYNNQEYGSLREFFPPMSPDVLDAAVAVLLDAFFDQIPIQRVTPAPHAGGAAARAKDRDAGGLPAQALFKAGDLAAALPQADMWDEDARVAFEAARTLWARAAQQGPAWDAAQTERAFVQPLLRALGWSAVPVPDAGGADAPAPRTTALCADDVACAELYMEYADGAPLSRWVWALMQAAPWGCPPDRTPNPVPDAPEDALGLPEYVSGVPEYVSGVPEDALGLPESVSDATSGAMASHRLIGELKRTGVRWGIATNGRVWRLISRDANSLVRTFYEVDLGAILARLTPGERPDAADWAHFRQWWLLFHRGAYAPDGEGRCLLDRLRERLPETSGKLYEILHRRLVGIALPVLAGGFIAYRHQRLGIAEETPVTLQEIYHAAARLLTRLVFVLAAEARQLLPAAGGEYEPYSLTRQARWAQERVTQDLPLSDGVYTTPRYDLLLTLLHRISRGDADRRVPCYGSLFFNPVDDEVDAFLDQVRAGDRAVAIVLDALTRDIDYTALDARDLGCALGALSGCRLLVLDAASGDVTAVSRTPARPLRLPDYVITDTVEQALAPVLAAQNERFGAAMARVVALRRALARTLDRDRRAALYTDWEAAERAARQAFLGLRVCDPAMGTGDFLIGAVDVLTDGVLACLQRYHDDHPEVPPAWNPIYRWIEQMRQEITEEVARQGVAADGRGLDTGTLLARLIARRCVFGVAREPLDVEVAKVTLWLHTFTPGAPLSLLDHHLQSGNGLLGADLRTVADEVGMAIAPLSAGMAEAAGPLYSIRERVDTTPLDVRWSASQAAQVQARLLPYRQLLDTWTTAALGDADAAAMLPAFSRLDAQKSGWTDEVAAQVPAWVGLQAAADGFFHWALAFPEAYIDPATGAWREAPGFDAVIGAPPRTLAADARLATFYTRYVGGGDPAFDVAKAYLALAQRLARPAGGRTALVLSRQWLASPVGGI